MLVDKIIIRSKISDRIFPQN